MKIYTSYWYQVRNFPRNLVGLNSTIWPPKYRPLGKDSPGVIVVDCPPLKPGAACEGLCDGHCAIKHPHDCKFLQVYRSQLDNINLEDFLTHLEKLAAAIKEGEGIEDEINFAIIVFEKPSNLCSERQAIWGWGGMCGLDIKEWQPNI